MTSTNVDTHTHTHTTQRHTHRHRHTHTQMNVMRVVNQHSLSRAEKTHRGLTLRQDGELDVITGPPKGVSVHVMYVHTHEDVTIHNTWSHSEWS